MHADGERIDLGGHGNVGREAPLVSKRQFHAVRGHPRAAQCGPGDVRDRARARRVFRGLREVRGPRGVVEADA